ncbi:hypothetical protein B0H16DRAFT_1689004 [Mycena metata]|uniref:Novel STAND NTPase 1 domain-containing protein n=1 Tax=Mycena metata TaxID=1033252 RepID=A0AAD7JBI4_9AGAR|nr:hypothetical protein B0H16DRAFT_1689004 [Mycena metata]
MPRRLTEVRLNDIVTCLTITVNTLDVFVNIVKISGLEAISNTTQSLLEVVQNIKQNKAECTELMKRTHELLNAIIGVYIMSDTGTDLAPGTLGQIAQFIHTLHKIHTFVEAQQGGSKVRKFFRQGELGGLLKECKAGLQQGFDFFQIKSSGIMSSARDMEEQTRIRHQEVLNMIETLSDSDSVSFISNIYSGTHASSNSISMLPAEPKIFHGRESELANILKHFSQGTPRIAILGAGGMGKTSLAGAVLHHKEITTKYQGNQFFVTCDTAPSKAKLAGLIGAHLGMKPAKDLTHAVLHHFSLGPPTLLILDNLETVWEPAQSRNEVEEFLSLLTDIPSLALISKITLRGAERPFKVQWTRPFLIPLEPLSQEAARKMFFDIADDGHSMEEVDQVLGLTNNMPLSISLLAHAVDVEGCAAILLRWHKDQTSVISQGYDRRSNLELSILLSLASPRIASMPHSQELLSLLSILPDGLSDAELKQSNFPIQDILDCKRALLRTALAYTDDHKRLKALVPIREYMKKFLPPTDEIIRPLLKHFQELLELFKAEGGKQSTAFCIERLTANYTNMLNIIQNGLQPGHPDLTDSIYCTSDLNRFSERTGRGIIPLMDEVITVLPHSEDHHVKAYFNTRLFDSQKSQAITDPEAKIAQTFEYFNNFNDPDLKCMCNLDIPTALKYRQMALNWAQAQGNIRRQSEALFGLSMTKWSTGSYAAGQAYAQEMQRLANISGNLQGEARGLLSEAICCIALGDYRESLGLLTRARSLLELCGLSQGDINYTVMNCQAEVHKHKSEYDQACTIHKQLQQNYQGVQLLYYEGLSLLNIAGVEVPMGVSYNLIEEKIHASKAIFGKTGHKKFLAECDATQADLNLREGDMSSALFCKCLKSSWGRFREVVSHCLERLADITQWAAHHDPSWSVIFLAHSLKSKEKLGIHKALQFIGDVHLVENDELTAVSLFTIALEGFTYMDVHHSRAECMIRLGDLAKRNGDALKALELWETARPLFERSSQAKRVQDIAKRIGGISEEVKEQHQKGLACLAELNVLAGKVEEVAFSDAERVD